MESKYQKFPVGINVLVIKNNGLLLGKRKNCYGAGSWGLPGGHLEAGETMVAAAARELDEETGLKANDFEFLNIINETDNSEHYLQVAFSVKDFQGEPIVGEPDKCEEWKWFDLDYLPEDVFLSHLRQIELFKKSLMFSDF